MPNHFAALSLALDAAYLLASKHPNRQIVIATQPPSALAPNAPRGFELFPLLTDRDVLTYFEQPRIAILAVVASPPHAGGGNFNINLAGTDLGVSVPYTETLNALRGKEK